MASQFLGKPGVTQKCFEAKGSYQCEYFKNGAWLGTELVCPPSGFSGMKQTGDVAVGIPCTPGQPLYPGSSISSTTSGAGGGSNGSGSSGSGGSGSGSGSGSGGSGSGSSGGDFADGVNSCVDKSFTQLNTTDTDLFLTFHDSCGVSIYIMWILGANGTPAGHLFAAGETLNQTGIDQNDVAARGPIHYYACPADHPVAVDPNGNQIFGYVPTYKCAKQI
jgi:hypothetical protein